MIPPVDTRHYAVCNRSPDFRDTYICNRIYDANRIRPKNGGHYGYALGWCDKCIETFMREEIAQMDELEAKYKAQQEMDAVLE